ncbi:hypothetical protein [Actinomadura terrae]|uniref:hypothetical protein n=1 Tax=Actinomadura terrae TaxID=604353 RepID=UPI001FA7CA07|nr:hypothetical protein [Actinomadura terrae]
MPRGLGSAPVRIAGYGTALLLVVAAVVVLVLPLIDEDEGRRGAAGARVTPRPGGTPSAAAPGVSEPPIVPSPGGSKGTDDTGGTGGLRPGTGGGEGGGPPMPGENGGGTSLTWCPAGTAYYRAVRDAVEVVITVSASGAIRAEMALRGYAPRSQQAAVRGGAPHTFRFTGVPPALVERVKVTTISLGVAMQTCYARVAAQSRAH